MAATQIPTRFIASPALSLALTSFTNETATGAADGTVILYGIGGTSPYTYNVDFGGFQSSNLFTGLSAVAHQFYVKDSLGVTSAVGLTVTILTGTTRVISSISGTTTGAAAANTDYVYLCSSTFTFTMPTAVGNKNLYTIKNTGTGVITIATTSSQTIDGTTTISMTEGNSVYLISNNSNWVIT